MFEYLLNTEQKKLRDEAQDFVKSIPRKMILDMDADKIQFPREFLQEAGKRNLMGCRFPELWGGRGMDWVSTCMVMEEIGRLGYIFACTFGVGAELVCDAIIQHGSDEQKEKLETLCFVEKSNIISIHNVSNIFYVPLLLIEQVYNNFIFVIIIWKMKELYIFHKDYIIIILKKI